MVKDFRFPAIKNEDRFEDFCLDYTSIKYSQPKRYGIRGQRQNGVDIYYDIHDDNNRIHFYRIQCKAKGESKGLTIDELEKEITKTKAFTPKLKEYTVMTTGQRDVKIQEYIRNKNVELLSDGLFKIEIKFWEDIEADLCKDEYLPICDKYFSSFFMDMKKKGYSFSKLFSIDIGVGDLYDTHYEIMIGKIIEMKGNSCFGLNYYQNSYFICNLNHKKMDTIRGKCYGTDLNIAFDLPRDHYIICEWLNKIGLENLLIHDNNSSFNFSISKEQLEFFFGE